MKERGRNDIESERTWKETGKKSSLWYLCVRLPNGCLCRRWKDYFGRRKQRSAWTERRTLCEGAAARQYIYNQERLLYPMKQVGEKGHGKFVRISWEEAYQTIAEKLLSVRERYGARSTIFYAGYPKWYRPALLRLANAYGSPNYCTESSTCFQASNMAWKSIYGNDICFPDLANANTVMLWASNLYHLIHR